jgi:hypothetical protein
VAVGYPVLDVGDDALLFFDEAVLDAIPIDEGDEE